MDNREPQPIYYLDGLSNRSLNCLYRAGVKTVDDLLAFQLGDLFYLRGAGRKTHDEIKEALEIYKARLRKDPTYRLPERRVVESYEPVKVALSPEDMQIPVYEIKMPTRLYNVLTRNCIRTLGDMLEEDKYGFSNTRGYGLKTQRDFKELKETLSLHGVEAIRIKDSVHKPLRGYKRGVCIDFDLFDLLVKDYGLKYSDFAKWTQRSRQWIYYLCRRRPLRHVTKWDGKKINKRDTVAIEYMLDHHTRHTWFASKGKPFGDNYHLLSNDNGDAVVIGIVDDSVRILWLSDLPEYMQIGLAEICMNVAL